MSLLTLRGVDVAYGDLPALRGIDLAIEPGEILSVVGANGAGKTTMLRAISGLLRPRAGEIVLDGTRLDRLPCHAVVEQGVVQVPEGRKIFPSLTVLENLELGSYTRAARPHRRESLDRVLGLFPILAERRRQAAGTMSGGQQQMLAIGRALMARPRLLMLDEPSLGLAPIIVQQLFEVIKRIRELGVTILLVEQNAHMALSVADRGYVLETGKLMLEGTPTELLDNEEVRAAYLGRAASPGAPVPSPPGPTATA
jgi:branched-chain amino acid transport system ATP-binding protein